MEIARVELVAIEKLIARKAEVKEALELNDLELALVGGGCGDITLG